jgi:geranylgeranyl reductase family protein
MGIDVEVLIVGGGPAGATVARLLAGAGREVLLLEKHVHPRPKPCGGGIPARTRPLLPSGYAVAAGGRVEEVELRASRWVRRRFPVDEPAEVVHREQFDDFLFRSAAAAGAEMREQAEVLCARRTGAGWQIQLRSGQVLRSVWLLAADGPRSRVLRTAFSQRPPCGIAIAGFVPAQAFARGDAGCAIFDLACIPDGYGWSFPLGDHRAIGLGTARVPMRSLAKRFERFRRRHHPDADPLQVNGALLPSYRQRRDWYGRDRLLLLGDAAGLVDPLTGEGIHYALSSAYLAAEAIAYGTSDAYNRALAAEILPELDVAAHFARRRGQMPNWALPILLASPRGSRYARLFVELLAGTISYRTLYERTHGGRRPG